MGNSSPNKRREDWYQNALLLAVAGSIIALVGTFASSILPIVSGPQDSSDFSLKINQDELYRVININNSSAIAGTNITVEDLHGWIRPYRFPIHFRALGHMNNTTVVFDPPDLILQAGLSRHKVNSSLDYNISGKWMKKLIDPDLTMVTFYPHEKETGNYDIIIQGVGGNGKIRNTTFYLSILSPKDYENSNNTEYKGQKVQFLK